MKLPTRHDILTKRYPHWHTLKFLSLPNRGSIEVFIGECDRESLDDQYNLIGRDYAEKLQWAGLVIIAESQWDPHFADGTGQIVCITCVGASYVEIAEEAAEAAEAAEVWHEWNNELSLKVNADLIKKERAER